MRVLIVSAVFPPEPVVSSRTSAQIAQALAEGGHDVTVICPYPSRPRGKVYPGYKRRLVHRSRRREGFRVIRCFSLVSQESRVLSRFLENLSFGLTAGLAALTAKRPDVIYTNTWPLFATGILFLTAKVRRVPMVISIQDVYPESLVLQGRIGANNRLVGWLSRVDGAIVRGCREVIVISKRFAEIYRRQRKVPEDHLHVVPNWEEVNGCPVDDASLRMFRIELKIPPDAFLMAYGGNIGMAAGVEIIIEAFRRLRDGERPYLLIAGEGSNLAACKELAREVDRIHFFTPWPTDKTDLVYRAANVLVLPTRGRQAMASVPSKLISYMLSERPAIVLAETDTDLATIVEQSGCGWVVEPNPRDLVAKIKEVAAMEPDELRSRGLAGRRFASRNFTREACLPQIIRILERAAT